MQLRFIHVPKNGGSAVVQYLRDHGIDFLWAHKKPNGSWAGKHRTVHAYLDEPTTKFAVKRHPHTRLVSFYRFMVKYYGFDCEFDRFVREKSMPETNKPLISAWRSQCDWIYCDDQLAVHKVLRFEHLQKDLQHYLGLDDPVPYINVTNHKGKDLMAWYTAETYDLVQQHFARDFQLLGY